MPDAKTLARMAPAVGGEAIGQQLHQRLVEMARERGVIQDRKMRVDTTVVETNIHYPTNSKLLGAMEHACGPGRVKRIENGGAKRKRRWRKGLRGVNQRGIALAAAVDFAEMAAISLSNAIDLAQRDQREERYMAIVKRYKPEELASFPKMLAEVVLALEEEPADVLGRTFRDLELHNKWSGQFFSPLLSLPHDGENDPGR